jgi:2-dehydropantoate 2-reductase
MMHRNIVLDRRFQLRFPFFSRHFSMKICIIGAGSIGGLLAAKLAHAGLDVTVVARGPHFAAIRDHGLRLLQADGSEIVVQASSHFRAVSHISEAGVHDVVILGMKAHQVEVVVPELGQLLHPKTMVVPMQNGIPWWYFQRHGGPYEGTRVAMVDPNGVLASGIDPANIIGCVVYPAAEISAPGVIRHIEGNRFPLGELDGGISARVAALAEVFERAGFRSPVLPDIRAEIWLKLWGNLTFNPISALTHATLVDICQFSFTRELAEAIMLESQAIANKLGIEFRVPLEKRIAGAEKVGRHKTSMLQDIEAGRAPELDALVGSVIELGKLTATPTPHINAVYACGKLLAKVMGDEKVYIRAAAI